MNGIIVGDTIEYHLMSGFHLTVLGAADCDQTVLGEDDPHEMFLVLDLVGNEAWLCEHDVTRIT